MVKTKKKKAPPVPTPVKVDSRIGFAIEYFTTEADAMAYDAMVRERGDTYNGGWFHGMACGREKQWDYVDATLGPLFAVTT